MKLLQLHLQILHVEGMQASSLFLHQLCLIHLQLRLLQGNEDLAFLQLPVKANGELGAEGRGMQPSMVVLPSRLGLGTCSIMVHVRLP
jgi:hypothetical protein